MTDWVGRKLGRYHIESVIGQGAMGVVLQATDPELARTVAVKVLYPHLATDRELVERFRREARTAANLDHRSIVAIHDVGQEGNLYYLVMEYLEGTPLSKIIDAEGFLQPRQVLTITEQMASALDYIHARKLVHRDVKASNILVNGQGRAVLTDFGLARALTGSTLTASGAILGTPQYLAPEQISGGEIGRWTDLYGLGIVVYEMLTGRFPFSADLPTALFFQVLWEPPPPINVPTSPHPKMVNEVIERILAKEYLDRYPSGAAFAAALRHALIGGKPPEAEAIPAEPLGVGAEPAAVPAPPADRGPRRRWLIWGMVGIALFLMVGAATFLIGTGFFGNSPTRTPAIPGVVTTTAGPPTAVPPSPTPTLPGESPRRTALPIVPTRTPSPTRAPTTAAASPTVTPSPSALATQVPTRRPTQPPPTQPPPTQPPPTPTQPPPTQPPPTQPPPTQPPPTQPPPTQPPPTQPPPTIPTPTIPTPIPDTPTVAPTPVPPTLPP